MGALNDAVRRLLDSLQISSASPGHINDVRQMDPSIDLDTALQEAIKQSGIELGDPTTPQNKSNFIKNLKGISENDAKGVLGKAGISPKNLPGLLALSSGKGGLSFLTSVGGAAGLSTFLGPIALALAIKPVTEAIIKELQRPGGFLDKRVKIDARNEAFAEIDRQTRQNTRIGDRQVIIQQFQGFRSFDGYASTNTSALIRENADRVLDIGLFDRAQGVPLGGR